MNTNEEKLVTDCRIAEYSPTAAGLAEIRSRLQGIIYDVTDKRQMEAAKRDRRELVQLRTGLEAKRKELKAPALERSRLIDAEAKDIEVQIRKLEEPIDIQIKAEEARAESERLAKLEAERDRIETIMGMINALRELPGKVSGWPSARIAAELRDVESLSADEAIYEEFTDQAGDALAACAMRLTQLLADAHSREAEAERVRVQDQKLREAQAEAQRQQDRIDQLECEVADRAKRAAELDESRRKHAEAMELVANDDEERQRSLTLRAAAQALVDHCVSKGMGHEKPVEDLNAILLNSEGDVPQVTDKRQSKKVAG